MKRTALLRVGLVLLVLIGLALALLQWAVSGIDDCKGLALNLGTELVGAAVTYALFELVIERMEKREEEKKELEAKKADLIAQMGSRVKDVAIAATEELARRGWLYDGSLRGAYLRMAELQGVNLFRAKLEGVDLMMANLQGAWLGSANLRGAGLGGANLEGVHLEAAELQGASLYGATLRGAILVYANLQGANLWGADLREANLEGARLSEDTTLPDRTKWTPGTDMDRFTDPNHPDFWRPDA